MAALFFFALGVGVLARGDDRRDRIEFWNMRMGGLVVMLISGSFLLAKLQSSGCSVPS